MTAQLQQSIKLLQLSSLDLTQFIQEELEKNPLLAAEGEDARPAEEEDRVEPLEIRADAVTQESSHGAEEGDGAALPSDGGEYDAASYDDDAAAFGGGESYGASAFDTARGTHGVEGDEHTDFFDRVPARKPSLRDHLIEQLHVGSADPAERLIGRHLIDLLDESGYITDDLDDVAAALNTGRGEIEAALSRLQRCDPAGIGARNLAECLALQLREKNRCDPAMAALLEHLDLLARGEYERLMAICGVESDDMAQMVREIRQLNPKPGASYHYDVPQAVIPDIIVRRQGARGWHVELNSDALPRVLVNRSYYVQLLRGARNRQEKKYLSDHLAQANWLVRALDQRAQTILRVASDIVIQQQAFLDEGIHHLRPLTLRDVADRLGLHQSTISRVTAHKFMATPRGTYELKYFFTSSLGGAEGEKSHSSRSVQFLIKQMIDAEIPDAVVSDDEIAAHLRRQGIDVARRTVAKYREAMHIPSSQKRRRMKASML